MDPYVWRLFGKEPLYFLFHTPFYRARSLSAGLFLYWSVSRCAGWADCSYTGQSPDVQNRHGIKCGDGGEQAGGRVAVGVKGEDVAEERLGSIDVVGCGGWQMEEAALYIEYYLNIYFT